MSIEIFNSSYSNVVDGETTQVADQIALHRVGDYDVIGIGIKDGDQDTMILNGRISDEFGVFEGDWMELIEDEGLTPNYDNPDEEPGFGQLRYGGTFFFYKRIDGVYHGSWEMPGGDGSHGWNLTAQVLTLGRVGLQSDQSE